MKTTARASRAAGAAVLTTLRQSIGQTLLASTAYRCSAAPFPVLSILGGLVVPRRTAI
eukprot:CAMPEP_0173310328 /NCGR_PEP_ID=MMETSP1143-20121109/22842_1 /TAXON_ID=483371 /ORGANISM="non described non described, Strain CCMP2298" /LENGTH=57 /DNA_ID=CAMNT_0014252053 /DNA_START=689 /DNA_END=859 /DNA_ORIENTATION=-